MDIYFIRHKVKNQEYDLSSHAHRERQEEEITAAEIEQALLRGDIKVSKRRKEAKAVLLLQK